MKKIIYFAVAAMMFSSCNDFLDSESYTQKNTGNYPLTAEDAEQVITGIYNNLNIVNANPQYSFFYYSELASDDRLGGGGFNEGVWRGIHRQRQHHGVVVKGKARMKQRQPPHPGAERGHIGGL